jgi:uncharacterized membrane-anchored protein YhcB (DUF1043 family)
MKYAYPKKADLDSIRDFMANYDQVVDLLAKMWDTAHSIKTDYQKYYKTISTADKDLLFDTVDNAQNQLLAIPESLFQKLEQAEVDNLGK